MTSFLPLKKKYIYYTIDLYILSNNIVIFLCFLTYNLFCCIINLFYLKGLIFINLVAAIIIFNILILIYQIIIEIFSVLFRLNGVSFDKAKFQVISMLTGTGFTTNESESILLTQSRRKLAQNIMLFSYIFNVSIVSIIVNLFVSTPNTNIQEIRVCIFLVLVNLIFMIIISKFQPAKRAIESITTKLAHKKYNSNDNLVTVYDTYGKNVIAEVELKQLNNNMKNKSIQDFGLRSNYNVQLLIVKRNDEIISDVKSSTIIENNDILVVFGKLKDIHNAFGHQHHKITEETKIL